MKPFKVLPIFVIIILCSYNIAAQSTFIPLHNQAYHILDRIEIKSDTLENYIYSSVKPYTRFYSVLLAENADLYTNAQFRAKDRVNQYYIYKDNNEWNDFGLVESKKTLLKHFYKYTPDFFYLKDYDDFLIKINPLLHFELAKEGNKQSIKFQNTRGIELRGMIGERFGFYGQVTENQSSFAEYVNKRVYKDNAVAGEGRFKDFSSTVGNNVFAKGFDYFGARGYITYQPIESIRLQFGHDKNFIGNGIRSLILSDFANSYLFLKLNTKVWKFNYQNLFMQLSGQFNSKIDTLIPQKYAAIHHLSFNINKHLNLGIFESVTYSRSNGFDLNYLNPLIFYRALEYHLGSADNVLVGLDWKLNFLKRFSMYGQFVIDEYRFSELKHNTGWWGNKSAFQIGLKYIDVFKISNLDAQVELNSARPYIYSHYDASANYTHYNQPLAHPLGANFNEVLSTLSYKINKQVFFELQLMYAQKGEDNDTTNWGGNIFLNNSTHQQDTGNKLLQGYKTKIFLADACLSWMPKHNLFFDVRLNYRKSKGDLLSQNTNNTWVGMGMRLNLPKKTFLY